MNRAERRAVERGKRVGEAPPQSFEAEMGRLAAKNTTALLKAERVIEIVDGAAKLVEDRTRRAAERQGDPRACARGCTMCCHLRVEVTAVEAVGMLSIIETFPDHDRVLQDVAEFADRYGALSTDERSLARAPCPLLSNSGDCRVYARRPLACRGWNSVDLDLCRKNFGVTDGPDVKIWGPPFTAANAVAAGVALGTEASGRDPGVGELATVLTKVAERGERWLKAKEKLG